METFPIRPLFDRVIVREIPIEDYYEQSDVVVDLSNAHIRERSDRGVVVAAGRTVEEVEVGDTVQYDEYCLSDPIYLNPAHKNRPDLPKYWQIRVHDLKGVRIQQEELIKIDLGRGLGHVSMPPEAVEKLLARMS